MRECVEELRKSDWVVPALRQFKNIASLFYVEQPYPSQSPYVIRRDLLQVACLCSFLCSFLLFPIK